MDKFFLDAALVLALTEVVKRATHVSSRFLPLVSVGFGILLSWLTFGWSNASFLEGLVVGLVASGLYSSSKASVGK